MNANDLPVPVGENNTASLPLDIISYDFSCIGSSFGVANVGISDDDSFLVLLEEDEYLISASISGSGN